MNRNNLNDWLQEAEMVSSNSMSPAAPNETPSTDPNQGVGAAINDPNIANMDNQNNPDMKHMDVNADPKSPIMPADKEKVGDFETWKNEYFKESVKGDATDLIQRLNQVREKDNLLPVQKKFVEDNYNIQLLRQSSNIDKASRDIRKNIKDQLDRNNPSTSVINHIHAVLETIPTLNNIFIKISGYGGLKGDLHRKYIAALLGAVQVGSGANTEDILYNTREFSIRASTRFNSQWGDIMLGNWQLSEGDPAKFLEDPEIERLKNGSPEEKDSLRKRLIIESMADQFNTRAFIINVAGEDGTVYSLGWDLANSLKSSYTSGKIVVKTSISNDSEALISADGTITQLMDIDLYYVKQTGDVGEDGFPATKSYEFISRRDGMLFLTADLKLIKEAASTLSGISLKETPYNGNPSDLKTLTNCRYSTADLLLKAC